MKPEWAYQTGDYGLDVQKVSDIMYCPYTDPAVSSPSWMDSINIVGIDIGKPGKDFNIMKPVSEWGIIKWYGIPLHKLPRYGFGDRMETFDKARRDYIDDNRRRLRSYLPSIPAFHVATEYMEDSIPYMKELRAVLDSEYNDAKETSPTYARIFIESGCVLLGRILIDFLFIDWYCMHYTVARLGFRMDSFIVYNTNNK